MTRRYSAPDGWTLPAFQLALDPTPELWRVIRRQWGRRRYADNWAVRTLKADLDADREETPRSGLRGEPRETSESGDPSFFPGLRWRWNRAKQSECVDWETGKVWWPQISKESPRSLLRGVPSKEAFANGIEDACRLALAAIPGWQARRPSGRGCRMSAITHSAATAEW